MKHLVLLIFISSFALADNMDIKYFLREHNYDTYKLVKKLKFDKEITKNDFDKYHSYVKVFYTNGKIKKYESFNKQGKKIYEAMLNDKEQIKRVAHLNGVETTYLSLVAQLHYAIHTPITQTSQHNLLDIKS